MTNPRAFKTLAPGGGIDAGADEVLEALNRPAPPRAALPVPRAETPRPVPHTTRLEPRGYATSDVEPSEAFASLPAVLAEIASVAGLDAAVTLAEARGGTRIYVPASAADDHWLVRLLGREAADRLCYHYAITVENKRSGTEIELPLSGVGMRAETWRRLEAMIRAGAGATQITAALGVSRATIKRHRAKLRLAVDGEQLSLLTLFDELDGRVQFDAFAADMATALAEALSDKERS